MEIYIYTFTVRTQMEPPVLIGVWAYFCRVLSPQNRGHLQVPGKYICRFRYDVDMSCHMYFSFDIDRSHLLSI